MVDGYCYKYDVSLSLSAFYQLVEDMRTRLGDNVIRVVAYGHVGDGMFYIYGHVGDGMFHNYDRVRDGIFHNYNRQVRCDLFHTFASVSFIQL